MHRDDRRSARKETLRRKEIRSLKYQVTELNETLVAEDDE